MPRGNGPCIPCHPVPSCAESLLPPPGPWRTPRGRVFQLQMVHRSYQAGLKAARPPQPWRQLGCCPKPYVVWRKAGWGQLHPWASGDVQVGSRFTELLSCQDTPPPRPPAGPMPACPHLPCGLQAALSLRHITHKELFKAGLCARLGHPRVEAHPGRSLRLVPHPAITRSSLQAAISAHIFTGPEKRDGKGWCFINAEFYSGGDEMGRLKAGADRGLQLSRPSSERGCQQFPYYRHLGWREDGEGMVGRGGCLRMCLIAAGQFWGAAGFLVCCLWQTLECALSMLPLKCFPESWDSSSPSPEGPG